MSKENSSFIDMGDFNFNEDEFGSDVAVDEDIAISLGFAENDTLMLPVDKVHPDPNQPRKSRSDEEIENLRATIKAKNGNDQAIQVRPHPELDNEYMIITGEGRWGACSFLNIKHVKAEIVTKKLTNYDIILTQMSENIGRSDMNLIDTARGYKKLVSDAAEDGITITQAELSKMFGINKTKVSRMLKLASADLEIQNLAESGFENLNTLTYLGQIQELNETEFNQAIKDVKSSSITEKELHKLIKTLKDEAEKQENIADLDLESRAEAIDTNDTDEQSFSSETEQDGSKSSESEEGDPTTKKQLELEYVNRRAPSKLIESDSEKIVLDIDGVEFVIAGEMLDKIKETLHKGVE
ncbi:ParB/RepB/Spo0J family partition protein [Photobacterium makurazakiensis]|uniref:ParB/RepB/Spo0J family partition protein n=1 Tax=Photobacterium makurazakiensis TaxID=2910234 RepID=UPI003D0AD010